MPDPGLDELRSSIDAVDAELIELLDKRTGYAIEIGRRKAELGLGVYSPEREKEVFDRIAARNAGKRFPDAALRQVFTEIISVSRALQQPLVVAYLGPKASYTHMAVLKHFGSAVEALASESVPDIFAAVERGQADYGMLPIENSNEGVVSHNLDQFVDSPLSIVAEIYVKISHCLLSTCTDLAQVKKLYGHPQALAQCRMWIQNNLPNAEIVESASNSRAAQLVAWEKYGAAIAGRVAAGVYELNILAQRIEDNPENITRFLAVGRNQGGPSGQDRTSLVCSVKDRPGALHDLLAAFSARGVNMTKIESRPTRKKAWEYLFFIDVDGHVQDPGIAAALGELEKITQYFRVLGSYPTGRLVES